MCIAQRSRLLWSLLLWFAAAGCGVIRVQDCPQDQCADANCYCKVDNWVLSAQGLPADFDVFYIYPTLIASQDHALMNHREFPRERQRAEIYVRQQFCWFPPGGGIYAPFVRQLEITRCLPYLKDHDTCWADNPMKTGIDDTVRAFRYYLTYYNQGRPYVLVGHSQGAIDLYELLRRVPEITERNGFVAAYLPGLPLLSAAEIEAPLAGRGLRVARTATDLGVIVVWNTQTDEARESFFTRPHTAVINPVTWQTNDDRAVPAAGGFRYDDRERDPQARVKPLTLPLAVRADAARGALIAQLPAGHSCDAPRFMGAGVLHMNDVFFFAPQIRGNILDRVKAWREKYPPAEQPARRAESTKP